MFNIDTDYDRLSISILLMTFMTEISFAELSISSLGDSGKGDPLHSSVCKSWLIKTSHDGSIAQKVVWRKKTKIWIWSSEWKQ